MARGYRQQHECAHHLYARWPPVRIGWNRRHAGRVLYPVTLRCNRRQFASRNLGMIASALGLARAQDARLYSAEMPNMAVQSLAQRLNEAALRMGAARAKIRTASQLLARNQLVRSQLRKMLEPFPARGPLKPRTAHVIERKGYRIENVLFQS